VPRHQGIRRANAHEEQFTRHTIIQQEFFRAITNVARCGKPMC
jgi:hypothetical protein